MSSAVSLFCTMCLSLRTVAAGARRLSFSTGLALLLNAKISANMIAKLAVIFKAGCSISKTNYDVLVLLIERARILANFG